MFYRELSGFSGILFLQDTAIVMISIVVSSEISLTGSLCRQLRWRPQVIPGLLLALLLFTTFAVGQASEVLSLGSHIPLPGVKGRIDHFSVDVKGQRLFVAAVENHSLEVIDVASGKRVHSIAQLAEPQGVFYDPSTNHLFVACAMDGSVKVFDGTTFQILETVKFPDDADNIRYDARNKGVIVGYAGAKQLRKRNEGSGGLGFIDLNGKKTGDIVIDAHPESFQLEQNGSRIFVNVPEKKEIEVVDASKRSIVARWPISAEDNFPMALDEVHHRLLIGVWKPPQLWVLDTNTGKQVAAGEIAGKTDDLFYDSARSRVYVLTSAGYLDVFAQRDGDRFDRIARYPTPPGAQTGLFVPEWGKLFVAIPAQGSESAEIRVYQAH
jgi:DNA-binding beta-propeller fold protein YncE